jgi:hypothetical protein
MQEKLYSKKLFHVPDFGYITENASFPTIGNISYTVLF